MKNLETLIPFDTALEKVLLETTTFGTEKRALNDSSGYLLAQEVQADRDFPPFDRSTRDGIAIFCQENESVQGKRYAIEGIAPAGTEQMELNNSSGCIEIMTGAILPKGCNAVVMYEHIKQEGSTFQILEEVKVGQNIHEQGSDVREGISVLEPNIRIGAAEIGVMATVGLSEVSVKTLPKVAVITTGNELVEVHETPLPHQIRTSNSHTLLNLLSQEGISSKAFHILDDPLDIKETLQKLLQDFDVLLLSGGVSKGKYDFLPQVFTELEVEKLFHKVLQRPGKPFWFGKQSSSKTLVFAFPGNPVSTYVNYHLYFKPWLAASLGQKTNAFSVALEKALENNTPLDLFIGVKLNYQDGRIKALPITTTGSGDLAMLTKVDGFVRLRSQSEPHGKDELVPFLPTKPLFT
ncbi:MAG: molybdopterin molybdotransferase MoeA [Bacteroidota bacterium]